MSSQGCVKEMPLRAETRSGLTPYHRSIFSRWPWLTGLSPIPLGGQTKAINNTMNELIIVLIAQVDDTNKIPRQYKNMSHTICGESPKIILQTTDNLKPLG